jgi:hypothetical protein
MYTKWTHVELTMSLSVRMIQFENLSAWFNSRTAGRILIKYGMDVMSLKDTLKSYFLVSYNR